MVAGMIKSGSSKAKCFNDPIAELMESMPYYQPCFGRPRTLLNTAVRASGRIQSTNSRLISEVSRHARGVLQLGSSSFLYRSRKLQVK
jgi:hypothetical protein